MPIRLRRGDVGMERAQTELARRHPHTDTSSGERGYEWSRAETGVYGAEKIAEGRMWGNEGLAT